MCAYLDLEEEGSLAREGLSRLQSVEKGPSANKNHFPILPHFQIILPFPFILFLLRYFFLLLGAVPLPWMDFVLNNSVEPSKRKKVLKQREMGLNAQRAAIKAHYFLTLLVTVVVLALQLESEQQPQVLTFRM